MCGVWVVGVWVVLVIDSNYRLEMSVVLGSGWVSTIVLLVKIKAFPISGTMLAGTSCCELFSV